MANVIDSVIAIDRCSGCGVCAGICPRQCLKMVVKDNGDLVPIFLNRCIKNCNSCLTICPFETGIHNPRQILSKKKDSKEENYVHGLNLNYYEDSGHYICALVGRSNEHILNSASGGLLTFCLESLLANKLVDAIAIPVLRSPNSNMMFVFKEITNPSEIRRHSGSIYQPVECSEIIQKILSETAQRRWAITGVPCLCTAVRKAMLINASLRKKIKYILGLACGMYQNVFYTELLIKKSGIKLEDVSHIYYRVKIPKEPANNYGFQAVSRNGIKGKIIKYLGFPFFLGYNGYFRLNACNYCMDVFAENADACFMDAWLPEYRTETRGTSIILIRNPDILALFKESAVGHNQLQIADISISSVIESQRGHVRRKRQLIKMRIGESDVDFHIYEYLHWLLQKRTQSRSKWAWSKLGRRFGVFAFWIGMIDLLILQRVLHYAFLFGHYLKKVIRGVVK